MQLPVQLCISSWQSCSHHFLSFLSPLPDCLCPLLPISLEPLARANGGRELVFCMNEWALSVLASRHPCVREPCESVEPITQDRAEMSVAVYSLTGAEPTDPASCVSFLHFSPFSQSSQQASLFMSVSCCKKSLTAFGHSRLWPVPLLSLVSRNRVDSKPFSDQNSKLPEPARGRQCLFSIGNQKPTVRDPTEHQTSPSHQLPTIPN